MRLTALAGLLACMSSPALAIVREDWHSLRQAQLAAGLSAQGASAGTADSAKFSAASAIEGDDSVPEGQYSKPSGRSNLAPAARHQKKVRVDPIEGTPADGGGAMMAKPPKWAVYGGAALLGGISAGLTGGLFAALGGAVVGLGAAYLFEKGDYGAAFGMTLGGILGSFLGGPLGGLIGAAVGGLLGHFIGKMFSKPKAPDQ